MRDLHNNSTYRPVIVPVAAAPTGNTPQVGTIIDRAGYDGVEYVIMPGLLEDAGATWTALLEESDLLAMGDATAVADKDLLGTEALASFIQTDDSKCFKLGYVGSKRYTRLTLTPANNASNAPVAAFCHLGFPNVAPTANPPA